MCALMIPIVKSEYKLYPGMPVKKRSAPAGSLAYNNNNNNLTVPGGGSRHRSVSLRSNISAQSNPEFSFPTPATSANNAQQPQKRDQNSRSLSNVNTDDVRKEKLRRILEEKERQRKISTASDGAPYSENSPNKNPFAKLLKHFGIKTSKSKHSSLPSSPHDGDQVERKHSADHQLQQQNLHPSSADQ